MLAGRPLTRLLKPLLKPGNARRAAHTFNWSKNGNLRLLAAGVAGGGAVILGARLCGLWPAALTQKKQPVMLGGQTMEGQGRQLTPREQRFLQFATLEHCHRIFMTPRDFLDSVTEDAPRARIRRRVLTDSDLEQLLKNTPSKRSSCKDLFRNIDDNGLVSYTEYLFLLSVLTKAKNGFWIAFNMFDRDGNQKVDKQEFLVVQRIIASMHVGRSQPVDLDAHFLESVAARGRGAGPQPSIDEQEQQKSRSADTTLLRHFFGKDGSNMLSFDQFQRFYDNLQTEVLEIEFSEYAGGRRTITETEFAQILLRYTMLHADDYERYLDRVTSRLVEEKGITFEQFRMFCQFLNSLDDFEIAIKLFTYAGQSISQEEFSRAVKVSSGHKLDPHVVNTVFQIFDENGDGELSYSEFYGVMKDRVHRGFKSHRSRSGVGSSRGFRTCIRDEIRAAQI